MVCSNFHSTRVCKLCLFLFAQFIVPYPNTEPKGYFNDPILAVEGFNTYNIEHEIYALTRIVYFVMTGKMNTNNIVNQSLKKFVEKGLNPDRSERFKDVSEMKIEFGNLT